MGVSCFEDCGSLRRVNSGPFSSLERFRVECVKHSGVEEVSIPDGVCELEEGCFCDCMVKPRDRILLIATTSQNPLSKQCTLFNRCLDIPKPNYPTRALIWNFWPAKKGLQIPSISVNALSFASDE